MSFRFGGIKVSEIHFGNKEVTEVYLGINKIYPEQTNITYAIQDVQFRIYSNTTSTTTLGCTEDDYAYIMGTLITYDGGVETNRETVILKPSLAGVSTGMVDYFSIDPTTNMIHFNRDKYGKTDLFKTFGDIISTTWVGTSHGVESDRIYLDMYANRIENTLDAATGSLDLTVSPMEFNANAVWITAVATGFVNTITYYSSGLGESSTRPLTADDRISFYLDGEFINARGAGQTCAISIDANTGTTPRTLTVSATYKRITKTVEVTQRAPETSYELIYQIDENCVQCGACEGSCPVDAILFDDDGNAHIRPDECTRCGSCHAVGCPVGAIRQARYYQDGHIEWDD